MIPAERPFIRTNIATARWVAALFGVVASVFAVSALVLDALLGNAPRLALQTADVVAWATGALTYALVGVVVAWRRPGHAIGWLFLLIGVFGTSGCLGVAYTALAVLTGSPGAEIAAWYSSCEYVIGSGLILNVFVLLFPTGRVPSPRWTPVLASGLLGMFLTTLGLGFYAGQLIAFPLANPFGLADASEAIVSIGALGVALQFVAACAAIASVGVRLVRADRVERQQLKWMGAAVFIVIAGAVVVGAEGISRRAFGQAVGSLALNCIPIAAGIAILRYRLYDIDLVVNRALVYGGTTALIGGVFFGGVVILQTLIAPFTSGNEIAVAGSTLGSLAVFQSLRSRVQHIVDQRFYRSRYDAARTLDEFSVRLRDEVDLGAVHDHLLDAVGQTMQPATASLWLREQAR